MVHIFYIISVNTLVVAKMAKQQEIRRSTIVGRRSSMCHDIFDISKMQQHIYNIPNGFSLNVQQINNIFKLSRDVGINCYDYLCFCIYQNLPKVCSAEYSILDAGAIGMFKWRTNKSNKSNKKKILKHNNFLGDDLNWLEITFDFHRSMLIPLTIDHHSSSVHWPAVRGMWFLFEFFFWFLFFISFHFIFSVVFRMREINVERNRIASAISESL